MRNLYADQDVIEPDMVLILNQTGSKLGKEYVYCYPVYSTYAEYIKQNAGLHEAQAGIKTAGRNINSLRYADDTTLMAEIEEELKSVLMNMKEDSEKLALNSTLRKVRSWHPVPSLHRKQMGKQQKQWQT